MLLAYEFDYSLNLSFKLINTPDSAEKRLRHLPPGRVGPGEWDEIGALARCLERPVDYAASPVR